MPKKKKRKNRPTDTCGKLIAELEAMVKSDEKRRKKFVLPRLAKKLA